MNKIKLLKSKKFIISSIITFIVAMFIFNTGFINIIKPGFYFEKYNTGDKAREEYYEKIDYNAKYRKIHNKLYFEYKNNRKKYNEELQKTLITSQDEENIIKLRQKKQYKKDATTELLKLHPISSNIKDLENTLEKSGAIKYYDAVGFKRYKYKHISLHSIFYRKWSVIIKHSDNKINNIIASFNHSP
tara:strand:+ start:151 stop:714 length:564 start_codon:yes stop_codon:yes gene_type:complete